MIVAALAAVVAWTLVEYVIHRWLGHDKRFTGRNGFGYEHVKHHADGNHFARPWKKVVFFALAAAVVVPPAALLAGAEAGGTFSATLLGCYLVYEVIHRRMHTSGGVGAYGRLIRRLHFHHHFHDPKRNFGVSSPLWDLVFGTWTSPSRFGRVLVPVAVAMPWLLDDDGAVRPRYTRDYALRGRGGPAAARPRCSAAAASASPAASAPHRGVDVDEAVTRGLRW